MELRLHGDGAGQQPIGQWRIGQKPDAALLEPGEELRPVLLIEEREAVLDRVDVANCQTAFDQPAVDVAHADRSGKPSVLEFGHGLPRLLDRDLRVGPVQLVEIDAIGSESGQ